MSVRCLDGWTGISLSAALLLSLLCGWATPCTAADSGCTDVTTEADLRALPSGPGAPRLKVCIRADIELSVADEPLHLWGWTIDQMVGFPVDGRAPILRIRGRQDDPIFQQVGSGGTLEVENLHFVSDQGNQLFKMSANMTVEGSTFEGWSPAIALDGGLWAVVGVSGSTFTRNAPAILVADGNRSATLEVSGSTFLGNRGGNQGRGAVQVDEPDADVELKGSTFEPPTFGDLFRVSPCGDLGTVGCTGDKKYFEDHGQWKNPCNTDWKSYFESSDSSITMTSGTDDCRTVNTYESCRFDIGDGGVAQITFDFEVAASCHEPGAAAWLSFWMYRKPWYNDKEVDFIEGRSGPYDKGLNTNFAGWGQQVGIFTNSTPGPWTGSIEATFSGTGDAVEARVGNSHNDNVGKMKLGADDGYFFVLDTSPYLQATDCTITVSNLALVGQVDTESIPDNCIGVINSSVQ